MVYNIYLINTQMVFINKKRLTVYTPGKEQLLQIIKENRIINWVARGDGIRSEMFYDRID